ncbi:MAG: hypothetical protein U5L10_04260 [Candidatus Moranbacteria bacterium]|nr:hypothetical protein [Candidatus Moranbacteria bacterium]
MRNKYLKTIILTAAAFALFSFPAQAANYKYERVAFYPFSSSGSDRVPVYRFWNRKTGDHFYTTKDAEKKKVINNYDPYKYESVAFYGYASAKNGSKPVYRFYNSKTGDHFYTISESEKNRIISNFPNYDYEGIKFYAYSSKQSGAAAVYRFWNLKTGDHFYTTSESEKDRIINNLDNYKYENIAFYAYPSSGSSKKPVYRFNNTYNGDHFYTISKSEEQHVANNLKNYEYEGIKFYAYQSKTGSAEPVYRFYHTGNGDHFYTISESEKSNIQANYQKYKYEGAAFYAHSSAQDSTAAAHRFWDSGSGDHFYTIDEQKKARLEAIYAETSLGPEIKVGLWYYTEDSLQETPFKIKANKDYKIKNHNGTTVARVNADEKTRVTYASDGKLKIYESTKETLSEEVVYFEAADGNNSSMIFDVYKPDSPYDQYRGKIELRYNDTNEQIWVINALPLEQYVWGDGELRGTGDMNHNRVMVTSFRTYGYWKILYSTKYAVEGFDVNATPGNQLYKGYDYEKDHARVKQAAEDTQGRIVKHDGDVALTPYSSWTDGRTRSFEERWGSTAYPWCQSVKDPYGKHPTMSTQELVDAGNHMVGLSAHGSLELAGEEGWDWQKILNYYFTNIDITKVY